MLSPSSSLLAATNAVVKYWPSPAMVGLIALLTREGHEVIVAYATCFRGDRKIGDEPEAVVRRRSLPSLSPSPTVPAQPS